MAKWNILTTLGSDFDQDIFGPGRSGKSLVDLVQQFVHFGSTQVESKVISACLFLHFPILYPSV